MSASAMDAFNDDPLVQSVTAYVREYMKNYDASHSWDHIERVVSLAHYIYHNSDEAFKSSVDLRTVHLAALLHDVGDHKYLRPGESATTQAESVLAARGAAPGLAAAVQAVCLGVSYTAETRDPARVAALARERPELAVVQDADRLDALGAVGLARMFAFAGARSSSSARGTDRGGGGGGGGGCGCGGGGGLAAAMAHLDEKLVRLEGMMKTDVGRRLARVRTERLRVFRAWWMEEVGFVERSGAAAEEEEEAKGKELE